MHYHKKKAAAFVLSIACVLPALATTAQGDTAMATNPWTKPAAESAPQASTQTSDHAQQPTTEGRSTPAAMTGQGIHVISVRKDESGEIVQTVHEVTPDQLAKPAPTPTPVQARQRVQTQASASQPKPDPTPWWLSTHPPAPMHHSTAPPVTTAGAAPSSEPAAQQVAAVREVYNASASSSAPTMTLVPNAPVDVGLVNKVAPPKPHVVPAQAPAPPKPAQVAAKPAPQSDPGFIEKVLTATKGLMDRAVSWLGTRYVWGGASKWGVDCSGLTKLLYEGEGIALPHLAKLQFQRGMAVARAALLPGDLVFFNTPRGPLTHVGIYIGNGQFLHAANPRRGVRVDRLDTAYYLKRFAGARRYKPLG